MYEDTDDDNSNAGANQVHFHRHSHSTKSNDKLVTESFVSENELMTRANMPVDVTFDPICPVPFNKFRAEKLLPDNLNRVKNIDLQSNDGDMESSQSSSEDEFDRQIKNNMPYQPNQYDLKKKYTRKASKNMGITKSSFGANQTFQSNGSDSPYNFKRKEYSQKTKYDMQNYKYQIAKGVKDAFEKSGNM